MQLSSELYLSYPTTFDPIPTINFRLLQKTKVSLSLLDQSKKIIKNLIKNELLTEGFYSKPLLLNGFPRGIYYYTLKTEKGIEIKKLIY
jgi:hypothetical protein